MKWNKKDTTAADTARNKRRSVCFLFSRRSPKLRVSLHITIGLYDSLLIGLHHCGMHNLYTLYAIAFSLISKTGLVPTQLGGGGVSCSEFDPSTARKNGEENIEKEWKRRPNNKLLIIIKRKEGEVPTTFLIFQMKIEWNWWNSNENQNPIENDFPKKK